VSFVNLRKKLKTKGHYQLLVCQPIKNKGSHIVDRLK